jgi:hypothetical protein
VIYRFARFTLDSQAHVLSIGGRTVPLPRKAVETLEILIEAVRRCGNERAPDRDALAGRLR